MNEHCGECGKKIVQIGRGRPRKFCSDTCKRRTHNRRQNRRRLPMRDLAPMSRACAHCGAIFTPRRRDQVYCPGKWCAQAAYRLRRRQGLPLRQVEQTLHCQECGGAFTAFKANARWCSALCKNRNTSRLMSRRRGPAQGRIPYTDLAIFERDDWMCHLCGQRVDPSLPRTDWLGATIDHVTPISRGGADEPENVALAHWKCNHAKRASIAADLMPMCINCGAFVAPPKRKFRWPLARRRPPFQCSLGHADYADHVAHLDDHMSVELIPSAESA